MRSTSSMRDGAASSVCTAKRLSTFGPTVVLNATSAASRPRAITIRPMRVHTFDGELVHLVGAYGFSPEVLAVVKQKYPLRVDNSAHSSCRCIVAKVPVHIQDIMSDPIYDREIASLCEWRSMLAVPTQRDGVPLGAIVTAWAEPGTRPKQHEDLLKVFAAQAVIAIENTRLLNELRQRTDDLSEALEQQTSTAEVLGVISSSPGDLKPVFETMLENATRICEAKFGTLYLREADGIRAVAMHNAPRAYAKERLGIVRPSEGSALDRAGKTKRPYHIADARLEEPCLRGDRYAVSAVELGGVRTVVVVPMLKEGELIGAISIYRQEVRPFTDKQIALLTNFAHQAVIAIENTRLLNELRESLQQQTATADVLQVISSSPGELEPVFQAMLTSATRICGAKFGMLYLYEGDCFRCAAHHNVPPAMAEHRRLHPVFRPGPNTGLGRVAATKQTAHISDVTAEQAYIEGDPTLVMGVKLGGYRTVLSVPMLKENRLVGAINIYRQQAQAFTDKQIELVSNFASQAVIAIENARLLNELRESLENQTASADILRAIASSPAKAERALNVIAETTARRFEASNVNIRLLDGNILRYVGSTGPTAEHMQAVFPEGPPDANTTSGKAILERRQTHLRGDDVPVSARAAGIVSSVATPLIREGQAIGVLMVLRGDPRPFIDTDLAQLSNFADQAVIAIEN